MSYRERSREQQLSVRRVGWGWGAHCAVCLGEWLQPITGGRAASAREITITREMTGWQAHPIIRRCRQTNRHTVRSICSTHARTIAWKPPSLWSAGRFLCDSVSGSGSNRRLGLDERTARLRRIKGTLFGSKSTAYIQSSLCQWTCGHIYRFHQSLKWGGNLPSASVGPLEMKVIRVKSV